MKQKGKIKNLQVNKKNIINEQRKKENMANRNLFDFNCYFGVADVRKIASLVASGMDIEVACDKSCVVGNERATLYLLFARECYAMKNMSLGDSYIRRVEHVEEKSGYVVDMMNRIKKNRLFFPNQVKEGQKRLCLQKTR